MTTQIWNPRGGPNARGIIQDSTWETRHDVGFHQPGAAIQGSNEDYAAATWI